MRWGGAYQRLSKGCQILIIFTILKYLGFRSVVSMVRPAGPHRRGGLICSYYCAFEAQCLGYYTNVLTEWQISSREKSYTQNSVALPCDFQRVHPDLSLSMHIFVHEPCSTCYFDRG